MKKEDYYEEHESRQELEHLTKEGKAHRRWLNEGETEEQETEGKLQGGNVIEVGEQILKVVKDMNKISKGVL